MKKIKKIILSTILFFCLSLTTKAASFNMTASTTQVSPNGSFTIKVGGDCIGRVDLSVTNGSLSSNSVWVEQGYVSVKVTAKESGNVTIVATPVTGFSDTDANIYNPGSRSVMVRIAGITTSKPNKEPEQPKSKENRLSALKINKGTLIPEFNENQTEYTINLDANETEITLSGTPKDAKAKIEGLGKKELKVGKNKLEITVIAENGAKKTYIIYVNVDETPQIYLDYDNKKIGVVRNLDDMPIPEGFEQKEYTYEDKKIVIFEKGTLSLIYGVNQENQKNFYLFNQEKKEIMTKVQPIKINHLNLYLIDKTSENLDLIPNQKKIEEHEVTCYRFKNSENYCLLNAINEEGNAIQYLYEENEKTIQLFPDFLIKQEEKEEIKTNPIWYGIIILFSSVSFFIGYRVKKGEKNEKSK